jgi:large subunit ribosomal protein L25
VSDATLNLEKRDVTGKGGARKLRAGGRVPGVLYGENESVQAVAIDAARFEALLRSGAHHRLLELTLADGQPVKALVREIQIHPVSRAVVHVDLQRVSMQKRIRVSVPIVLTGKPEGVKTQGGILEHSLREAEVECLPGEIPERIEVEVSGLQVGQAIHISDLVRPGIQFVGHPGTTVATVSLPAAERSAEEVAAEAATAAGATATAEGATEEGKAETAEKPAKGAKGEKEEKREKGGGKSEKGSAS